MTTKYVKLEVQKLKMFDEIETKLKIVRRANNTQLATETLADTIVLLMKFLENMTVRIENIERLMKIDRPQIGQPLTR